MIKKNKVKKEIDGVLGIIIAFSLLGLFWFKGIKFNISLIILVVSILIEIYRWYLIKTK